LASTVAIVFAFASAALFIDARTVLLAALVVAAAVFVIAAELTDAFTAACVVAVVVALTLFVAAFTAALVAELTPRFNCANVNTEIHIANITEIVFLVFIIHLFGE